MLKKSTVVNSIISEIVSMIKIGVLKPGDKLPSERQLSETLDVSRTSVRTALQHLSYNKIVEIIPGKGTFVLDNAKYIKNVDPAVSLNNTVAINDIDNYKQRLECRLLIEPIAARLAALNATSEQIKELEAIIERMQIYLDTSTLGGLYIEEVAFHNCIASSTGNQYIEEITKGYCISINHQVISYGSIPNLEEESFTQHKAITNAIRDRNAELAEKRMREHIIYSYEQNAKYVYDSSIDIANGIL